MPTRKKKEKKPMAAVTVRLPVETKAELEELAERLPGGLSLGSLIAQMVTSALPMMRETVRVMELVQNAPNPSLVVEQLDAWAEAGREDMNKYAGQMNVMRREVARQHEEVGTETGE